MQLTEEQLKTAITAFLAALPAGTAVRAMAVHPRVGFADAEAGLVTALVLADGEEDFKRFEQIIARGISAYDDEPGLSARVFREMDT